MKLMHIKIFIVSIFSVIIFGCSSTANMHDNGDDKSIPVWQQSAQKNSLKMNLLWAKPIEKGALPTIIVHPGMGQSIEDMRGVVVDLAKQGFLSVAIDYQRLINGQWAGSSMPIRNQDEVTFIMQQVTENPWVDPANIALLGFSLGAAHSLKIAESNPLIKSVVVYYPMTDFVRWAQSFENHIILSFVIRQIKSSYLKESSQHTSASHLALVSQYSAINFTSRIQAPVLVIHGDKDRVAPVEYSQRFINQLKLNGNSRSQLIVVEDADHGFNRKRNPQAISSWLSTLGWVDKHFDIDSAEAQSLAFNNSRRY